MGGAQKGPDGQSSTSDGQLRGILRPEIPGDLYVPGSKVLLTESESTVRYSTEPAYIVWLLSARASTTARLLSDRSQDEHDPGYCTSTRRVRAPYTKTDSQTHTLYLTDVRFWNSYTSRLVHPASQIRRLQKSRGSRVGRRR